MVKEIELTQGKVALVDDEDYERVMQYKWFAQKVGSLYYAACNISNKRIYLHQFVLNLKKGEECDHINGNGLDNHKSNLRIVTHSQNLMNQRKQIKPRSSQYKGVTWDKKNKKWISHIKASGFLRHLGRFLSELDAARAYDVAAEKYFGEYARLNFPESI